MTSRTRYSLGLTVAYIYRVFKYHDYIKYVVSTEVVFWLACNDNHSEVTMSLLQYSRNTRNVHV